MGFEFKTNLDPGVYYINIDPEGLKLLGLSKHDMRIVDTDVYKLVILTPEEEEAKKRKKDEKKDWSDIPTYRQELYKKLGYTEDLWTNDEYVDTDYLKWDELNEQQKEAAK